MNLHILYFSYTFGNKASLITVADNIDNIYVYLVTSMDILSDWLMLMETSIGSAHFIATYSRMFISNGHVITI